ncbi:MAG TPA: CHASE3 domain-containing protein [Candidatus Eisenbacteria bacterium]|nr:CHASE3 domain-containing protein [Candidatus Eisenbacteria bacterium]
MPKVLLRHVNIGFGFALIALVVIGLVSYGAIRSLIRNSDRVEHTQEVMIHASRVQSLLADAETGQRGFLLTGDPMYLEPYTTAAGSLRTEIDSLRMLTSDNPRQRERTARLRTLADQRLEMLTAGLDSRRKGGVESARVWLTTDRGRQLMDQVRGLLTTIRAEEAGLLHHRDKAARRSASFATILIIIGSFAAVLIVGIASSVVRRDIHRRIATEDQLRDARDRMEERVRERTAELEAVIETSPVPISAIDVRGNILLWNRAAEQTFGYSKEEMVGKPYQPPDEESARIYRDVFAKVTTGVPVAGFEIKGRKKDGSPLELSIYSAPMKDPHGRPVGVLAVIADLTEQRGLQDRLRQSQKIESVGKLAGGIAHDFNNLLTAITGYTDLLYLRLPGDIGKRELSEIRKASDRAASLTRQLLAFSRQQVLQPKVINVNEVVSGLSAMLTRLIGEDIELETALHEVGPVKADPFQLEQVLMNLTVNARDAMPRGGKLTIETANVELDERYVRAHPDVKSGRFVMIAVSDTGVGMDSETRARIFEPFFTTKAMGKGTGLGLSTVYGIVKQSQGHMWVYSEPGQGATFKVYLPLHTEAEEPSAPAPPARVVPRGWETILAVEDEESLLNLVAEILRDGGYQVLPAHGPKEAQRILAEYREPIHLLLTDVVMPGLSGRALADQALKERPGMRVLYMSGYTDNAIVHHGVLDPGVTFIQKPFTPDALIKLVREVLDAAEVSA